MREPLIIVGAGGQGRETALAHLLGSRPGSFLGFLDDRETGTTREGWPVLGPIAEACKHRKASFVIGINDPRTRRTVARRLAELGVLRWASVLHPEVRLHGSVRIGSGCAILGACQITTSVRIGSHCILNRGSQVSHDCTIGDFCSVNPAACVAGNVEVGSGCEIGSACSIRQGTRVGAGATLGMGAVVVKDVPDAAIVIGNPARLLASNPPW